MQRLIDAPSPEVFRAFENVAQVSLPSPPRSSYIATDPATIRQSWFLGVKTPSSGLFHRSSGVPEDPGCQEIKLGGSPWYAVDGIEVVQASITRRHPTLSAILLADPVSQHDMTDDTGQSTLLSILGGHAERRVRPGRQRGHVDGRRRDG